MKNIINKLHGIFIYFIIILIKGYQILISPILGSNCRFLPTCSEYAINAIKSEGVIVGSLMALKRILSCHPFGKKGYDPILKKTRK